MKLKDLARVLPAYGTMCVHDTNGRFALTGNPHDFANGRYKSYGEKQVKLVCPLASYTVEITVLEEDR